VTSSLYFNQRPERVKGAEWVTGKNLFMFLAGAVTAPRLLNQLTEAS